VLAADAVVRSFALRSHRLVLVFARLPAEEVARKPLARGAAPACVESLHRALLRRTLAAARGSGAAVRLVTTGEAPRSLIGPDVEVVRQIDGSFAARLERAVDDGFRDGWREVVVVGGDTADLEASHLRAAFTALEPGGGRAVLGPTADGGFYLLGLTSPSRAAFRHAALTTDRAFGATWAALAEEGFAVTELVRLHDVDGDADLRRLAQSPGPLRRLACLLLAGPTAAVRFVAAIRPIRAQSALRERGPPRPLAA
jgi:glycosyltransferase A (GT-A) superfamily protein (DUF2064 family)